jgi:hypothetical protein
VESAGDAPPREKVSCGARIRGMPFTSLDCGRALLYWFSKHQREDLVGPFCTRGRAAGREKFIPAALGEKYCGHKVNVQQTRCF